MLSFIDPEANWRRDGVGHGGDDQIVPIADSAQLAVKLTPKGPERGRSSAPRNRHVADVQDVGAVRA